MRILIVGGGGREHALAWKIAQSPLVDSICAIPGNAGIATVAECVPLDVSDLDGLAAFAESRSIDLTVVGPEGPLIAGIVDRFESRGLPIFGPSPDPARIEGSKVFAKQIMAGAEIPTADFRVCDDADAAREYVHALYRTRTAESPLVIKPDGVTAGKGVVVARNEAEAQAAIGRIMIDRVYGPAGDHVIVEECLEGDEASVMAITDGEAVVALLPSQDHKRVYDGDRGPNTGGMGAYAPVPVVTPDVLQQCVERMLVPAVKAIRDLGIPYRGVLYAGIMVTEHGPKVIEFNCRFGDPETQAILPLMDSDLVPLLLGVAECALEDVEVSWSDNAAVCVVATAGGYPGDVQKGDPIDGLEQAGNAEGCTIFHAGTSLRDDRYVTDGGRILDVTGVGPDLITAATRAYVGVSHITFRGMHYRKDIAGRALAH